MIFSRACPAWLSRPGACARVPALSLGLALVVATARAAQPLVPVDAEARLFIPTGDAVDAGWVKPDFDDSGWETIRMPAGAQVAPGPVAPAQWLADSVAEFSPVQGSDHWYYGVYDLTGDANHYYNFTDDFNPTNRQWSYANGSWQMGVPGDPLANPPWDAIGALNWHPNGVGNGGNRWPVRRYISEGEGRARIVGMISHNSANGDGTVTRIRVDGREVFRRLLKNRAEDFALATYLHRGAHVDFMLDPGAAGNEGSDTSWFRTRVVLNSQADSRSDWSFTGTQGSHGWSYGYSDRGVDPDGYQAGDFVPFQKDVHWTGTAWVLDAGGARLTETGGRGQTSGRRLWAVRRYACPVGGRLLINAQASLFGADDGVIVRLFLDGTEVYARSVQNRSLGVFVPVEAAEGSLIDLVIDPNRTDAGDENLYLVMTLQEAHPGLSKVADTLQDWSATGVQGQNQWHYGYYDRTADADGVYQPATDFEADPPAWNFLGGIWRLGTVDEPGADPPWGRIGLDTWHPGGANSGGEQWMIRRWISDRAGSLSLLLHHGKSAAGGDGTTVRVWHNGEERGAVGLAGSDRVGRNANILLPRVKVGDVIDLALTPEGLGGGSSDLTDESVFNASLFETLHATNLIRGALAADSLADWSDLGRQGFRNWFYGYYDRFHDGDGVYHPAVDFNREDSNWTFGNGVWQLGVTGDPEANPPWDTIGRELMHPNGADTGGEHWAIKRWVSEADGSLGVEWQLRKLSLAGLGVTGLVLHNGEVVDQDAIEGVDQIGVQRLALIENVQPGDLIELALTPEGPSGNKGAGSDGSHLSARVYEVEFWTNRYSADLGPRMHGVSARAWFRIPFVAEHVDAIRELALKVRYDDAFVAYLNGVEVARRHVIGHDAGERWADSPSEFSGVQGRHNWFYGYYGKTLDYDGVYQAEIDFFTGDPDWIFDGYWQLGIEGEPYVNPPWTLLNASGGHPNGFNNFDLEEWAVRRYVSEFDGVAVIVWHLAKSNTSCGNGVTGRIMVNGREVLARSIEFDDAEGVDGTLVVPGVRRGDLFDFAIDPAGADGVSTDGCDGTIFVVQVHEGQSLGLGADSHAERDRPPLEAVVPEIIGLNEAAALLQPGRNVLALHGLNFGAEDLDFLQEVELVARYWSDLRVERQGESLRLSWNEFGEEQVLEETDRLDAPISWTEVPGPFSLAGDRRRFETGLEGRARYYRLRPVP